MKTITVQWVKEEKFGYGKEMRVIESNHPRLVVGSRFDFGFMSVVTDEGYTITSLPMVSETKQVFGRLNGGGYWKLLTDLEEVQKQLIWYDSNEDYVKEVLSRPDGVIAINSAGGFHGGDLSDYTDQVEAEDYPLIPEENNATD